MSIMRIYSMPITIEEPFNPAFVAESAHMEAAPTTINWNISEEQYRYIMDGMAFTHLDIRERESRAMHCEHKRIHGRGNAVVCEDCGRTLWRNR